MKLLPAFLNLLPLAWSLNIESGSLRTEGVTAPLGIHMTSPRLSWRLFSDLRGDSQTAYQVQAASNPLSFGHPDLWDSGVVRSTRPVAVYSGKEALASREVVYWRARVWDIAGRASAWSETTSFEMGLLDNSDWTADWITNTDFKTGVNSLPIFAKEFNLSCDVDKARLYITGLGVYRAEINGKSVSEEVLGPGYSTVNRTVLYRTLDVKDLLQSGSNVLGVALGKGTYDAEVGLDNR
jgi:hypothetical protein